MHPKRQKPQQSIMIYYAAEITDGEISTKEMADDELNYAKPAKFVTLDELLSMDFMCSTQEPLETIIPYLKQSLA
jgi:hypothetical protein